jgi:phage shock protein A
MSGKKFIYWLMGDRAGKVTIDTWNWLWGIGPATEQTHEPKPDGAFAVAETSLAIIQQSIDKLSTAVARQTKTFQAAKQKYDLKLKELRELEETAKREERNGREHEVRLAIAKAIQLEKLLAELKAQLEQAEQYVVSSQNRLMQEQIKLEKYRAEIQNMRDLSEVNTALREIAQVNDELEGDSAKASLEEAKSIVIESNLREKLLAELSQTDPDLSAEDVDNTYDEVNRRLAKLRQENSQPPKHSRSSLNQDWL